MHPLRTIDAETQITLLATVRANRLAQVLKISNDLHRPMLKRFVIALLLTLVAVALIDRASLLIAPYSSHSGQQNDYETANYDNCTARKGVIIAGIEWLADLKPDVWTALATRTGRFIVANEPDYEYED